MRTWDEFRPVVEQLIAERPDALAKWPDPSFPYYRPPFEIGLQAFAVDVARELHERFGADVTLQVGVMSFPDKRLEDPRLADPLPDLPLAEQAGLDVQLVEALTVRSGRTIQRAVLISNRSDTDVEVATTGNLHSNVLDPGTGKRVGGDFGFSTLLPVMFRVARGMQTRIPVSVGTTSVVPELGYAVPPGEWHLQVDVELGNDRPPPPQPRRRLRSAPLSMTITA
jgi:hypothetical protein